MTLETAIRPVQSTPPAEPAAPPDAAPADALPQRRSHVRGLRCRACGRPEALGPSFICPACFGPLEVEYDHDIARSTLTRDAIARRAPGIWRYLELLPVERAPERGRATDFHRLRQARVLMRAAASVPARPRVADIAVVETSAGQRVEDVTLVEDLRPAVVEETAAGRFDRDHRPDFMNGHLHAGGRGRHAGVRQREAAAQKWLWHWRAPK